MSTYFKTEDFRVLIGGRDVTDRWRPLLKSLAVNKAAGQSADSLEATLADPEGRTVMPSNGEDARVELGHLDTGVGLVFLGTVTDVRSRGAKGSGCEISIAASSVDHKSKVKEPALRSAADKTLADVAHEWGGKVGLDVTVIGDLAGTFRPYWIMQHESFMAWGQRTARELGATFKIVGKRAFFSPRNEGLSVSGQPLTKVLAECGEGKNLLTWDVAPILARPRYATVRQRHYDIDQAKWVENQVTLDDLEGVLADLRPALASANATNADQAAKAASKQIDRGKGQGTVTIIGDHAAEPEAECEIKGARPGVDGVYRIDSVSHSLSKGVGFITSLTLRQPKGGAGKDTRGQVSSGADREIRGASVGHTSPNGES
ncbi:phage late control D family protein [Paradevosia shaoguanensis]|uniref:phage late control D family protein n=1 Tax=Paradevosia shaoguanensis TaxID=1335043 RepID=UPI003C76BE41